MEITQEKYKYMYIIEDLKNSLKRWDQTVIAKKMSTESTFISWILNWSRSTSVEVLSHIAGTMKSLWLYHKNFKELEKEATEYAYKKVYWEELISNPNTTDLDIAKVMKEKYNLTDEEFERFIKFAKIK